MFDLLLRSLCMDFNHIAYRVAGKPVSTPPKMKDMYDEVSSSYIAFIMLQALCDKYGARYSGQSVAPFKGLGQDDAIYREIASMMSIPITKGNMVEIPLDLSGWSEFRNLKVPFDTHFVEEFERCLGDANALLDHVHTVYPGVSINQLVDFVQTNWVKPLYFGGVGKAPFLGAYLPDRGAILISLYQIREMTVSGRLTLLGFKHHVINSIKNTLEHEFVHYAQKLRDAIVAMDHEFSIASGGSGRTRKTLTPSDASSTWSTDVESNVCLNAEETGDPSLYDSIFKTVPPPGVAEHLGQFIKDREFKSRMTELVDMLKSLYPLRNNIRGYKPGELDDPEKFLRSQNTLVDTVFGWAIDNAKTSSFKKRLTAKYDRLKKEVERNFLRSM